MDVSDKIDAQTKQRIRNYQLECRVLQKLLKEREAIFAQELEKLLTTLNVSPTLYGLGFNFAKDEWRLELKPDMLVVPNGSKGRAVEGRKN